MTEQSFDLVPLDCPSCGAAVDAEGEDVVYYCVACRNGYVFDEERRGLEPLEVAFVAAAEIAAERYGPFWRLPADVTILDRQAAGGNPAAWIGRFFSGGGQRGNTARGQGVFIVPAFRASLTATLHLMRAYTEAVPRLGERLGERLVGGCCAVGDAEKLTHCALIATEVEKRDTLLRLQYDIRFGEPSLLGVPFVRQGEGWKDALFGVAVAALPGD